MAFVLTYTNLVTEIEKYLERSDSALISSIPLFIMLGERRVARDLKILGLKVYVTDTLLVGQQVLAKPTRWLNTSSFTIGTGTGFNTITQVLQRSYEYCRMYWPDPTQTAQPKYFSDYQYYHFLIAPTPDAAYPYELSYYQVPQLIDGTTSTNWITENAPDILIYACLVEAAVYLKDDDRLPVWTNLYENAKGALSKEDRMRIYDSFSKRGG